MSVTIRNLQTNQPTPIFNNLRPTFEQQIEAKKKEDERNTLLERRENFQCQRCGLKLSDHPMWYGFCMICDFE